MLIGLIILMLSLMLQKRGTMMSLVIFREGRRESLDIFMAFKGS